MLVADDVRKYVMANRAACLVLRIPEAEVRRYRHDDLVAPERRDEMKERWEGFLKTGTLTGTSDLLLPDGAVLTVDFAGVASIAPHRHLSVFLPTGWDAEGVRRAAVAQSAPTLTDREHAVLLLLATGISVDEIAGEMFLSPNTVRTHIRNARLKLGAGSRAHAIALAFRAGLLGPVG